MHIFLHTETSVFSIGTLEENDLLFCFQTINGITSGSAQGLGSDDVNNLIPNSNNR